MISAMKRTNFALVTFAFLVGLVGTSVVLPGLGFAQQSAEAQKVKAALEVLKGKAAELGPATLSGEDTVGDKAVPVLFFGDAKINNRFDLVDAVQKEVGGTATIFVNSGDQFVRVATNVLKDDGSRAVGTILDPKGKVIEAIRKGQVFYGEADILGKIYTTGYEPIRDPHEKIIGIFYVGYAKGQ
jgi:hypothetical protein